MGSLSVLNVGKGDIQISFNHHDAAERDRARAMLADMRARGYAILLRLEDGTYTRAIDFDAETGAYIVQLPVDVPPAPGVEFIETKPMKLKTGRRGRHARASVPMEHAQATAVARSAGG